MNTSGVRFPQKHRRGRENIKREKRNQNQPKQFNKTRAEKIEFCKGGKREKEVITRHTKKKKSMVYNSQGSIRGQSIRTGRDRSIKWV